MLSAHCPPISSRTLAADPSAHSSFICSAYVHSGLIANDRGGCGIVSLLQNVTGFPASSANGIKVRPFTLIFIIHLRVFVNLSLSCSASKQTLPFPSVFPLAFSFAKVDSLRCRDLRWEILGYNVAMGVIFSLFLDPGPLVYFWLLVCVSYWQ